jgi:hypothetical protein
VERWAIQELRLWEGPYHEPTPAGSVRRLKNWNKEGRFLEAEKLHQTKNVNIKFICPQPRSATALTSLPNVLTQETKIETREPAKEHRAFPGRTSQNKGTLRRQRRTCHVDVARNFQTTACRAPAISKL